MKKTIIRTAAISRETRETKITAELILDGSGTHQIATGIGFLDHMLSAFAVHGGFDLTLNCKGDLEVDSHHTVEDVGIVLGQAILKALSNSKISRYGSARIPMDESLGWCDIDVSNRPYLVFRASFTGEKVGELETQMIKEFMQAFAFHSRITLHIGADYGDNDHHKIEAMFKALAYALRAATRVSAGGKVISTKGVL
jgi:imidazoleglycerol-phosphate dehydratase